MVIDPVAPRYVALTREVTVPMHLPRVEQHCRTAQKHPKDPSVGTKDVFYGLHILLEAEDAEGLKERNIVSYLDQLEQCHSDQRQQVPQTDTCFATAVVLAVYFDALCY